MVIREAKKADKDVIVALEKAGPDKCYLGKLVVLPEHRNKSFGQALVNHLIQQASQMGIRRVEIGLISKHS